MSEERCWLVGGEHQETHELVTELSGDQISVLHLLPRPGLSPELSCFLL